MKQNETTTGYPSLDNLKGMTVEQLLTLRQEIRKIRDARRVEINEEQTRIQSEIRREGISERRVFDIRLNELKRQMDDMAGNMGAPASRLKAADLRDKMSELKYDFNIRLEERETRLAKSATERLRQTAQCQLDYENAEIQICRVIRDKGGFEQMGFRNQDVKTAGDNDSTEKQ